MPDLSTPMNSVPAAIMSLFVTVILAPVTEEFIFRGIVLNAFKKYGTWFAIIASSILWAAVHGNLEQSIPVFFIGIFLGILALKSGSVLPTMVIHIINNALSCALGLLSTAFPSYSFKIEKGSDIVLIAIAIVLLIIFRKEFKVSKEDKFDTQQGLPPIKPYKVFFTSWPILTLLIVCTAMALFIYISPIK